MQADAARGADRLDGGVDEVGDDADGEEQGEGEDEGDTLGPFLEGLGKGRGRGGQGWGDGVRRVEDDVFPAREGAEFYFGEVGVGVGFGDACCVVDCGAIVGDVGVEGAACELGEARHEDGVGVGEHGEERFVGVAELVDAEELPARHAQGSRA